MDIAPNSPRQGVVGGFAIAPPGVTEVAGFDNPGHFVIGVGGVGNASPWIDVSGGSFSPIVGGEVVFAPTTGSGLPIPGNAPFWISTVTYGLNALAMDAATGICYRSLQAANTNHTPSSLGAWWQAAFNFRGAWVTGTAYAVGDVVTANDSFGVLQTWLATQAFTSGPTFLTAGGLTDGGWQQALPSGQIFYITATSGGAISVSTSPGGGAVAFLSGAFGSANVVFGVSGFGSGTGLTPALSMGALFAQGTLWLPTSPPACPPAPASAFSYLAYNSSTGLYWTSNPAGTTAGDAVLGWVNTSATDILAASVQNVPVAAGSANGGSTGSGAGTGGSGFFVPASTGGAPAGIDLMADVSGTMTPDGSKGFTHQGSLTAATAIAAPINMPATEPLFLVQIIQPSGSGAGYVPTFSSFYVGMSEVEVDTRKGRYSNFLFQLQAGGASAMLLFIGNGILNL